MACHQNELPDIKRYSMAEYHFPVEDKFSARDVTEADFDITKYPDLIVELEAVRTTNRFNNYKNALKTIRKKYGRLFMNNCSLMIPTCSGR